MIHMLLEPGVLTFNAHIFCLIRRNVLNANWTFLAGQSAGAHLPTCSLIMQAKNNSLMTL
jgi:hypothetical protein